MPKLVKEEPEGLRVYSFHGLDLQSASNGNESIGTCPFCGREGKFYINVTSSKFRCVVCNHSGNQYVFLRELHKISLQHTQDDDWKELAENRKLIDYTSLKDWGVCKSAITDKWLVPGFNAEGKLNNLYRYDYNSASKRMMLYLTPTLGHQLFGVNLYSPKKSSIYLTEGIWDAVALWEILRTTKYTPEEGYKPTGNIEASLLSNASVVSIPVAQVFNDDWVTIFSGKDVMLMGQNDHKLIRNEREIPPASRSGMVKIAHRLQEAKHPPRSIRWLQYGSPETEGIDYNRKHGYDIRDYLSEEE